MLRGWEEGFEVPSLGVLVDHRLYGRGIGRLLTSFAISKARDLRCARVRLSVNASNQRALALYESLGFYPVDRVSIVEGGQHENNIIMVKNLA